MLTKTTIALAMALTLGVTSAALAANRGGYREFRAGPPVGRAATTAAPRGTGGLR
jgi:hypothetical protein